MLALRDVTDRRQAEEEAGVLAFQYAADLTVVAEVARRLPRTADAASARTAICEAALEVCDGAMAVLMEPDGARQPGVDRRWRAPTREPLMVPMDHTSSATAQVFALAGAVLRRPLRPTAASRPSWSRPPASSPRCGSRCCATATRSACCSWRGIATSR